eukprot:Pgem_evm1s7328
MNTCNYCQKQFPRKKEQKEKEELKTQIKLISNNEQKVTVHYHTDSIQNTTINNYNQNINQFKCNIDCKETVKTYLKNTRPITFELRNIKNNSKLIDKFTFLVKHFCKPNQDLTIWRIINTYERGQEDFLQAFVIFGVSS